MTEKILSEIYFDPTTGYCSADSLFKQASKINKTITRTTVRDWLAQQPAYTLHKPARRKYTRNKVIVHSIDEQWQIDLVDMTSLAKYNDSYKFLLTCIDIFSKYAWAVPLKSKSAETVLKGFKEILSSSRKPQKVQSDAGTEFINKNFKTFLKEQNINFLITQSDVKASVVKRFNRTLKGRMYRMFTYYNTYRYIDFLPLLIKGYNHAFHRTIKMAPVDVTKENEEYIANTVFQISTEPIVFKFNVGDKVRLNKVKGTFEKGYLSNWTEETFIIAQKLHRHPPVYKIKDQMGEIIEGVFYEPELQKVEIIDDLYTVDKVLKTRTRNGKKEYFVKWKGYPDNFNSWVSNLVKL